MSGFMNRGRQHQETTDVYNPDLEFAQQDYADELHGQGSPIGSVGMSGGQFPTKDKDAPGFRTGTYNNLYASQAQTPGNQGYYRPGFRYNRPAQRAA